MDSEMSMTLTLSVFLIMLEKASPFYNQSYNGYTIILPDTVMDGSNYKTMELSFSGAQQWCTGNVAGSTLATIGSKDIQLNFNQLITSAFQDNKQLRINRDTNIRLNGHYHITNEWRWVTGRPNTAITVDERNKGLYSSYARLHSKNMSIYSENHNTTGRFICEYPDASRMCDLLLHGRCYKRKYKSRTWYDARNICLGEGGNLASFETLNATSISVTLKNLFLYSEGEYWIGMQKNDWLWSDTGSSIEYTDWRLHSPSDYSLRCLCLTSSKWEWNECDCSKPYPFICSINGTNNTSTASPSQKDAMQLVIIAVSCATIFVVFIIIAAVFMNKKRRNSDSPQAVKSSGYENPEYAITGTSTDFPVYNEIMEPKQMNPVSNTTYASVQMAEKTNEDHQVISIVYAELDLKPTI